jgi:hypothetical protein
MSEGSGGPRGWGLGSSAPRGGTFPVVIAIATYVNTLTQGTHVSKGGLRYTVTLLLCPYPCVAIGCVPSIFVSWAQSQTLPNLRYRKTT